MSGHSKWSTIKRKKGAIDAARGKVFTKIIKEITIAARMGGGVADANPRLRLALDKAKTANMPKDTIERAIKKGTGELEGVSYEEMTFEGYGPLGVAVYVEATTDNKNRTAAEIRTIFGKNGGNLGATGCVAYLFHKRGQFLFDAHTYQEDQIMAIALEAFADDIKTENDQIVVLSSPDNFYGLKRAFEEHQLNYETAEMTRLPETLIKVSGLDAEKILKLVALLEDSDDVQNVYANFDIDEDELARIQDQND